MYGLVRKRFIFALLAGGFCLFTTYRILVQHTDKDNLRHLATRDLTETSEFKTNTRNAKDATRLRNVNIESQNVGPQGERPGRHSIVDVPNKARDQQQSSSNVKVDRQKAAMPLVPWNMNPLFVVKPEFRPLLPPEYYAKPLIYTSNATIINTRFDVLPKGLTETDDRIAQQMALTPRDPDAQFYPRVILDLTTNNLSRGQEPFLDMECPINSCHLATEEDMKKDPKKQIHAVLLMSPGKIPEYIKPKQPDVRWIFFNLESPMNRGPAVEFGNLINWTATYRTDSTIVVPYSKYKSNFKLNQQKDMALHEKQGKNRYIDHMSSKGKAIKNYAAGKDKMIAWFVSNCFSNSGRLEYARKLQKYLPVDIYGDCGNLTCPRSKMASCLKMVQKRYKFYLAFENARCKDYITEKFYDAIRHDVIPVVLGAPRKDYERVAPPGSFIHVDDFRSPAYLAQYIHYLSQNDTAYNEYFLWKGHGEFVDNKFMCRICALLHEPLPAMWYEDLDAWWRGEDSSICDKRHQRLVHKKSSGRKNGA